MKIAFIGAGKVGTSFGLFLKGKKMNIIGYSSRTPASAKKASKITSTQYFENKITLINEADVIFLTVNDSSIRSVSEEIGELDIDFTKKIFVHMSGALSSIEMENLLEKGSTVASLHPMYPFSNIEKAQEDLSKVKFAVEGKGKSYSEFTDLITNINIDISEIVSERKILYHAAACIASNYFVSLIDVSKNILQYAGFEEDKAMETIEELVNSTNNNIFKYGTKNALTGPITRGDVNIISSHLEALYKTDNEEWIQLYKLLGNITNNLAFNGDKIDENQRNQTKKELLK